MSLRCCAILGVLASGLMLGGCVIGHDDDDDHHHVVQQPPAYYTTIDADFVLDTTLGEGAGVFVEYTSGGLWTVWTSCDTAFTGYGCAYDVYVRSTAPVATIDELDMEPTDYAEPLSDYDFLMIADTGLGSDAVAFTTDPGALVEMELAIDGIVDASYFVWYGNGYVHEGAPFSPVVFQPDRP